MDWIDEKGRIFGRVNVIDALVVLFVLAVVAAGASLVLGGEDSPSDTVTRHATVDLGTQSTTTAALVSTGDVTVSGADAQVTDVYRTPDDGGVNVLVRVALDGKPTDDGFRAAGTIIRHGTTLTLSTSEYELQGNVARMADGPEFETITARATIAANVTDDLASTIREGDTQTVAGTPIATVTGVETRSVNRTYSRVRVTIAAETISTGDTYEFGGEPLRMGRQLTFGTTRYELTGPVVGFTVDA